MLRGAWGEWKVLRLIAFTDRNPADHKATGINSTALHSNARPGQTQTREDCITHGLKAGQAYCVISTAQTHSICTQIQGITSFFYALSHGRLRSILHKHYRAFVQTQTCNLSSHLIDTHTPTQVMFLSGDPGPEPPGGPASLLWTNRTAVHSTSPVSPGPSPDIVWPAGLLTRPPSLPGTCRWVRVNIY